MYRFSSLIPSKQKCFFFPLFIFFLTICNYSDAIATQPFTLLLKQQKQDIDTTKENAIARAEGVFKQMHFDLSQYIVIAIDKNSPSGIIHDFDIQPFLPTVAFDADWWIVLFVPQNIKLGPPVCIYIDKHLNVVRGYIIGPPMKQDKSNEKSK